MAGAVVIEAVDPGHPDAAYCLDLYFAELHLRFDEGFDPGSSAAPSLDGFAPPDGIFLIAYVGGKPVGCGGFKRLDSDTAYIKRMWVDPVSRGLGIGRRLLTALEEEAQHSGYGRVCLDTHRSLTEARILYERSGYRECAALADEPYADHWFVKVLRAVR